MSMYSNIPKNHCSCGASGSAVCSVDGVGAADTFTRPNFFAGQLLTEDDLDLLVRYTTDKMRLHNRNLYGAGVVCGLEVGCHPCGRGRMIVHPGHALDCCGNDIVVPCAEELDINAMIHELRTRLRGGWECGDPCARGGAKQTKQRETAKAGGGGEFALWVVYDEQFFDHQTPYETDDPCTSLNCVPSRIRESYRFELRCPEPDAPPVDLFSRALACIRDFLTSREDVSKGRALQEEALELQVAQKAIAAKLYPHWQIQKDDAFQYFADLNAATERVAEHISGIDLPGFNPERAIIDLQDLAGKRLRWEFHDGNQKNALRQIALLSMSQESEEEMGDAGIAPVIVLDDALEKMREGIEKFEALVESGEFETIIGRYQAQAFFDVINKWHSQIGDEDDDDESGSSGPKPYDKLYKKLHDSYEARMLVEGHAYTRTLHGQYAQTLAALRDGLQRVLDRRRVTTDCSLADDLHRLRLPKSAAQEVANSEDVARFIISALGLSELVLRWLRECVCTALSPVCPSREEDGVLLASLRVDECEVLEICNLERRWILSSANMRYWLSPLRVLGGLLERACCELPVQVYSGVGDDVQQLISWAELDTGERVAYAMSFVKPGSSRFLQSLREDGGTESWLRDMGARVGRRLWGEQPFEWEDFSKLTNEIRRLILGRGGNRGVREFEHEESGSE